MSKFNVTEHVIQSLEDYGTYYNEERAIPSLLDGIKPSQRKILFSAHLLGLKASGKYRKVVNLVGETTKIYLHGNASLEGAITRMGQPHKMTYPLLDGSGNWGSQSSLSAKDSGAAASRYIECRISPLGALLLESLKDGTAKMTRNFDNTMDEPEHLFAPIPVFMLANQLGIGMGTATSIPSFRLTSVINATAALMMNKDLSAEKLAEILEPHYIQGATIINKNELPSVYTHKPRDGRARSIKFRATFTIKGDSLVVTNFPYDASPDIVVTQIEKNLESTPIFNSITKVQDTTTLDKNKELVSMEIGFKKKTDVEELIRSLCEKTSLQSSVSVNMVLLDENGKVKEYSVKEALLEWIGIYLSKMVTKLIKEKEKLNARKHILDGMVKALDEIDEIIELIKSSESKSVANTKLVARGYSDAQARAILDMKLSKLANMEYQELLNEIKQINSRIEEIDNLLLDRNSLVQFSTKIMKSYAALELYNTPLVIKEEQYPKREKIKEIKVTYAKLNKGQVKYSATSGQGEWKKITKDSPAYAICKDKIIPIKEEVFATNVDLLVQDELLSYDVLTINKEGKVKLTKGTDVPAIKEVKISSQKDVLTNLLVRENDYVALQTKLGHENIFAISELRTTGRGTLGVIGIKLSDGDEVVAASITSQPKWTGKRGNKGRKIKQ
jgi:DNA gyrase/topoisomerase IV subunit A